MLLGWMLYEETAPVEFRLMRAINSRVCRRSDIEPSIYVVTTFNDIDHCRPTSDDIVPAIT